MTPVRDRSIMLVEDSEEDFVAFRRALRRSTADAPLERCRDGEACLETLRDPGNRPSLVVLDLNLPALNGLEVLRAIREDARLRRLPVVILSTSADPRDVRRCYELGVCGYFVKAGDFEEFSRNVDLLAAYWMRAIQLP